VLAEQQARQTGQLVLWARLAVQEPPAVREQQAQQALLELRATP